MKIRIAYYSNNTFSEGPGARFAIWFQGCSIRCDGCINKDIWDFKGGKIIKVEDILKLIDYSKKSNNIEGVSFLGGEPFDQKKGVYEILIGAKRLKLNNIIFTGYTYNELLEKNDKIINKILNLADVLVDGKYIKALKTDNLYLRGSENQKIILLTDRFNMMDFKRKNSIDINIKDAEIMITGFPFDLDKNE
jgi:anaerobic ribonucleoside-triphosphate reductase activating protein